MAKTGSKRKQNEKDSGHVAFSAEDDKEFSIPYRDQQGMDFESLVSGTNKSGFLDEIALLKKGIITKDTPKHTYRRASAEIVKEPVDEESPITMAELNTRGLRLSKDHVIYSVPEGTIEAIQKLTNPEPRSSNSNDRRYGSSQSESSSTLSRANSVTQMWDGSGKVIKQCIQPGTNSKEFHVGNPNENARMKISNLKDGYSYKLSIKDDVCLLQKTSKSTMLLCWKSR
ncbi:hypothetical protein V3C99_007655 [Haemonchus contortus]